MGARRAWGFCRDAAAVCGRIGRSARDVVAGPPCYQVEVATGFGHLQLDLRRYAPFVSRHCFLGACVARRYGQLRWMCAEQRSDVQTTNYFVPNTHSPGVECFSPRALACLRRLCRVQPSISRNDRSPVAAAHTRMHTRNSQPDDPLLVSRGDTTADKRARIPSTPCPCSRPQPLTVVCSRNTGAFPYNP